MRWPPLSVSHISLSHWPCKTWGGYLVSITHYKCHTDLAGHVLRGGGHSGSRTTTTHMNISDRLWMGVNSVSMLVVCSPLRCSWYNTETSKTQPVSEHVFCISVCTVPPALVFFMQRMHSLWVSVNAVLMFAVQVLDTMPNNNYSLWVGAYSVLMFRDMPPSVLFMKK